MLKSIIQPNSKYLKSLGNLSEIINKLPSIVLLGWAAYTLILFSDRTIPALLYNGTVLSEHVHAGSPIVFQFTVDRYKICRVVYAQTIYDSNNVRYYIPAYNALKNRTLSKGETLKIGLTLPLGMSSGPARYESERIYTCNFTQSPALAPLYAEDPTITFNVE